jgi:hypothetical protein
MCLTQFQVQCKKYGLNDDVETNGTQNHCLELQYFLEIGGMSLIIFTEPKIIWVFLLKHISEN